jgi:hypothetical protein
VSDTTGAAETAWKGGIEAGTPPPVKWGSTERFDREEIPPRPLSKLFIYGR